MEHVAKILSVLCLVLVVSGEAAARGGGRGGDSGGRGRGSDDHGSFEDRGRGRGSDDQGFDDHGRGRGRHSHQGIVTELPAGQVGFWVVGGRRVRVDRNTVIRGELGLLGHGGFVEVHGLEVDGIFEAHEIEVHRPR